jgi:hypothetical protein
VQGSTDPEVKCTADPLKPTCDIDSAGHGTGLCRACQLDSECETGICRKAGDYPATSPLQTGQCVDQSQIAYANNNVGANCSDGTDAVGTQAKPFCTIGKAVSLAKGPYINVAPSPNDYGSVSVTTGNFIVNGPGRSANPSVNIDQVTVNGGTLTLLGVKILGVSDANTPSVICNGANSSLYLFNSEVDS